MTTLLQINASINTGNGQSSQLANQFVAAYRERHPDAQFVLRDVAAADPVPHLDAERFGAFITAPERRSPTQQAVVAYSDTLIGELQQANLYVRDFLRFVGIADVEFVYAEGLAISPESKELGLAKAAAEIERLAA